MFGHAVKHDKSIHKCLGRCLSFIPTERAKAIYEAADFGCGYMLPYAKHILSALAQSGIPDPTVYLVDPDIKPNLGHARKTVDTISSIFQRSHLLLYPWKWEKFFKEGPQKHLDLVTMVQTASMFPRKRLIQLLNLLRRYDCMIVWVNELNDRVTSKEFSADMPLYPRSLEQYVSLAAEAGFLFLESTVTNAHEGVYDGQLMAGMVFQRASAVSRALQGEREIQKNLKPISFGRCL